MALSISNNPDVLSDKVVNIHQPVVYETQVTTTAYPPTSCVCNVDGGDYDLDFNMLLDRYTEILGNYTYYFRIDLSKILTGIVPEPTLDNPGNDLFLSDMSTEVVLTFSYPGQTNATDIISPVHGYNQYPSTNQASNEPMVNMYTNNMDVYVNAFTPFRFLLQSNPVTSGITLYQALKRVGGSYTDYEMFSESSLSIGTIYNAGKTEMTAKVQSDYALGYKEWIYAIKDPTAREFVNLHLIESECDNPVVLLFFDRNGQMQQFPFTPYHTSTLSRKEIGKGLVSDIWRLDIGGQSKNPVIGYEDAQWTIDINQRMIKAEYTDLIQDLFLSNSVWMYKGTYPATEWDWLDWERVRVEGTPTIKSKYDNQNLQFQILREKLYTPQL
jgi:hypothetical protein